MGVALFQVEGCAAGRVRKKGSPRGRDAIEVVDEPNKWCARKSDWRNPHQFERIAVLNYGQEREIEVGNGEI
jgi:hypothetical protein